MIDKNDVIAAMCYALNREWNRANQDPYPCEWVDAKEEIKNRYRKMVAAFLLGHDEIEVHETARRELIALGYQPGSLCHEKKTHPYCVSYSELGLRLRLKYLIYRRIVLTFIENQT